MLLSHFRAQVIQVSGTTVLLFLLRRQLSRRGDQPGYADHATIHPVPGEFVLVSILCRCGPANSYLQMLWDMPDRAGGSIRVALRLLLGRSFMGFRRRWFYPIGIFIHNYMSRMTGPPCSAA